VTPGPPVKARALLYCAGGGIGDSLVASVVARALRNTYAGVDALTLGAHRATLERVPDFDDVLVDDGQSEAELATMLRERGYGACVVTWATPRTAKIPQLARIPVRVGQARRLYSFRFTHRVTVRSERGDVTSPWSDILLDYARALGCETADRAPRFVPTRDDEAESERLRAALEFAQRSYLVLHPTNAIASKRELWPVDGWASAAQRLAQRFGVPVALSGSPADIAINDAIVERASTFGKAEDDTRIVSIAGALSIGAFGAFARDARAFVGITTGSMHVAAAVGAPTVGIFPFQSDIPDRWAPVGERTAIVRPSFACHRGDTKENCADYACIAHLPVSRILAAVESLMR
jgi:ADP-heptose:LPS heptosyltransferase